VGTPGIELAAPETGETVAEARKGRREACADGAFREHDVYERARLPAGEPLSGPAIVEDPESTALIGPDATFRVDGVGNLLIDR
jgi:N-methylhydantoinase A